MAKKKRAAVQQFAFEAIVIRHTVVYVDAADEKEARDLAEAGDWVDEDQGSLSDFEIRGRCR